MTDAKDANFASEMNQFFEEQEMNTPDFEPIGIVPVKNSETADGSYYDGEFETIKYLEYLANKLVSNGIEPKRVYCICQALKYLSSRLGSKEDAPINLDLEKAENYIHRARTGEWMRSR